MGSVVPWPAESTPPAFAPDRFNQFLAELGRASSLSDVADAVVHAARSLMGAEGATFIRKEGEYCVYADEDAIAPLWKGRRFPAQSCVSGWCIAHDAPVVIPDISCDERVPMDLYRPTFVKSLAIAPVSNHATLAAIGVYWSRCRTFSDEDIARLRMIAGAAGMAIRLCESESENVFRTEEQRWARRYRAVFEQAAAGLATVSLDGRFLTVNDRLCRITGYARDELERLSFQEITHAEDLANDLRQAAALAAGEIDSYAMEKRYVRKDGSLVWIRLTGSLVRDHDGQPDYFIAVIEDMSAERSATLAAARAEALAEALAAKDRAIADLHDEQRQRETLEDELRHIQKLEAVGQLTAGIAHDFNNLLTAIIGNVNRAIRWSGDPQKQNASLRIVLSAADQAAKLTRQLLAFARKQPLLTEPLDVNAIVTGMLELLRRTMGEHVAIRTDLAERLPLIQADRSQLESAILNLALNGRDAMPQGGDLTIATSALADSVIIRVTDGGIGMDEATLARAAEPFFTTKEVGAGSGLGLSQVFGFLSQSGGRLDVTSRPGAGTTVEMRFAVKAEAQ